MSETSFYFNIFLVSELNSIIVMIIKFFSNHSITHLERSDRNFFSDCMVNDFAPNISIF